MNLNEEQALEISFVYNITTDLLRRVFVLLVSHNAYVGN